MSELEDQADRLEAEWYEHRVPGRDPLDPDVTILLRQLVDLMRDEL